MNYFGNSVARTENHDIYWRGEKPAPEGHHESNYETHFGPLWYSFKHKNAGFIVLYSDGKKVDSKPASGKRTPNQLPLYLGADPNHAGSPTRSFAGQLDEFRLSKGTRYSADFTPEKRYDPDAATVLLHHFDKSVGPFILDHSTSAANGILGPASELVPVK